MGDILNITNGDGAIGIMEKANIPGAFLPWRDVLHDGPVPQGLSLAELSQVRAKFIISRGWGTPETVIQDFIERDNLLKSYANYKKVILWFEHDLYDQLQILQILDWFHNNPPGETKLSLICTDQYLGILSPNKIMDLFTYEEPVTENHLVLSNRAWTAFRSSSPEKWHDLLKTDTTTLPFLEGAIIRLLEEYPDCSNGLSRTAQQILKIISRGEKHPGRVFGRYQESEDRRFLGDSSFWVIIQELLDSSPPLLNLPDDQELTLPITPDQKLTITPMGRYVLAGKRSWLDMAELDRWIGGVHLTPGNMWCWDSGTRRHQEG